MWFCKSRKEIGIALFSGLSKCDLAVTKTQDKTIIIKTRK
jgi:hypothetical protein